MEGMQDQLADFKEYQLEVVKEEGLRHKLGDLKKYQLEVLMEEGLRHKLGDLKKVMEEEWLEEKPLSITTLRQLFYSALRHPPTPLVCI